MRIRRSFGEISFHTLNYAFFILFTFLCVFPFYYLFINTISSNDLSARGLVTWYPKEIHFENYVQILKIKGLSQAAFISVARTVIGTAATVLCSAFLGYLFTKKKMWARSFWYRFMVVTMYFNAGIIPWFVIMMKLNMTNNFLAYILPTIVSPFFIILAKTFIESIPEVLQESAEIDGAGTLTVFWRIILPLIKPIAATIAIFAAVTQWNSFIDTVFLMTDQTYYTLQFVLYKYLNESNSLAAIIRSGGTANIDLSKMQTATSVRTTVSMIVVIPIMLVYPFFQRFFVKGIMIGAVKG
ncbi:carbohydrate ABC transporter permease [Cohnella thailandensis]|jgi:ABC-type sugar transport system, permease component|uniref:Carbohydrate ABC transporter permease n=1 Tax=Cohnella thailandensis TaxID=557557 RepID=A0A841T5T2_9BACL|nr:carbohydrate ABC transporter permease [Cohnella thailandensis]MBB6638045.1 carbohydrate ABC transporter permease [Cohnella thailandensis]MBP1972029.1 putative aldouronate transport system permease protein [Cohnella thailandensis]